MEHMVAYGYSENHHGKSVKIGKSSINGPFSIAMLDYQRVRSSTRFDQPRNPKGEMETGYI